MPRYLFALAIMSAPAISAADDGEVDRDTYLAPHAVASWWLSAQVNTITQAQPGFHSPYEGSNSFRPDDHEETSFVETVYAGYALTSTTALVLSPESASGTGLSSALGIAGFTDLDVVRNPALGPNPYIGRAFIDQVIPLSDDKVDAGRGPLRPFARVAKRRIEIIVGKIGMPDYFDLNGAGTDSHLQFMNWTVDNNGAWDYAADTRGYTLGAVIQYIEPRFAIRLGEALMPTIANGIHYDYDVANARGENLEGVVRGCVLGNPGVVRVLAYLNHAQMGNYDDTIAEFNQGIIDALDITATRAKNRIKYGFGLNAEQQIGNSLRGFMRLGWNDGATESFAYTEVDNTALVGFDLAGTAWSRPRDKIGVAVVSNGISVPHRTYLELGGKGFLLGDGELHYGREDIAEVYYTVHVWRGVSPAADVQVIDHPGYNVDRGPVVVGSLRLHLEI